MEITVLDHNVTKFGKRDDVSYRELLGEAALPILQRESNIEGLIIAAGQPELLVDQAHVANLATEVLGLSPTYINRVEMACSSGGAGIRQAFGAIKSGLVDNVLVIGLEKMNENIKAASRGLCLVPDVTFESFQGMTAYSGFALFAKSHMETYGTTREQLAEVSIKNHSFGEKNPKAHFYRHRMLPVTMEKVKNSPIVADPLTLLDCSPISDGAAAILLSRKDKAKNLPEVPVDIIGTSQRTAPEFGMASIENLKSWVTLKKAAQAAYSMADVQPSDIKVAETHDCFTIAEIMEYEALGFCPEGQGGQFIENRQSYPDGQVCVNPSGGLKAKGHPIGATGVAQAVSITEQLQGTAEGIQTPGDPQLGLTHNLSGYATNHIVHIFKRAD
ncbi:MAG: thiolase C-terminal domain-containing protein [Candidatus Hodarchaeales archaeon]